jgi:hypothetical protein
MIKKFHKFFESSSLHFYESNEYEEVKNKHKIPDEVIKDYFMELLDEGSEFNSDCNMSEVKDGIKLYYNITISKNIKNPEYKHSINTIDYISFIEEQSKFIKIVNNCVDRLKQGEDLETNFNRINQVPFWGAGNNTQEFGTLSQIIAFKQEIKTDDYRLAKEKFNKKDNPARKAIENVIKKLEEMGIKESRQLIDTQENDDIIFIGFLTDDEIIVIATWNEEYGLIYEEDELANAVNAYEDGYCDEILGK